MQWAASSCNKIRARNIIRGQDLQSTAVLDEVNVNISRL